MPALCLLRLAGSVLVQAHDEWQVAEKRYLSETTLALLNSCPDSDEQSGATPAAISDYEPEHISAWRAPSHLILKS